VREFFSNPPDAPKALGMAAHAPWEAIKQIYRRLTVQRHPALAVGTLLSMFILCWFFRCWHVSCSFSVFEKG
jgi:hypothetical protein